MERATMLLAMAALMLATMSPAAFAKDTVEEVPLPAEVQDCKAKKNEIRGDEDRSRLRIDIECRNGAGSDVTRELIEGAIPEEFKAEGCRVKKDEFRSRGDRLRITFDIECRAA